MADIVDLKFRMDAVGNAVPEMKKVQDQLGRVDQQMKKATGSVGRYTAGSRALARSQGNLTRNLGMASLQFQDIAVQASMGTSALRIMTMQGPQLASVFGPKGMIIGALVATAGALALVGKSASKTTFDFKKFGSDLIKALEPLQPVFDFVKRQFNILKEAALTAVNGMIRGFQYFGAIVTAVIDRVAARIDIAQMRLQAIGNATKSFFQSIKDMATMGEDPTEEGAVIFKIGEEFKTATTKAEAFKLQSEMLFYEANQLSEALENQGHVFDVVRKAMEGVVAIDIRDYFVQSTEAAEDAAKKLQSRMQGIADTMKSSFENGFMSIVDGTKSVKDAFKQMAKDVISQLYRVLVVQRIVGSFNAETKTGTGMVGALMSIGTRANGGPVSAGKPYIVGERGPELMVPSSRGTIVPNNKLGGGITVHQTFQFAANGDDSVKKIIAQAAPQIAKMTQQSIMDARRRGGQMKAVFG